MREAGQFPRRHAGTARSVASLLVKSVWYGARGAAMLFAGGRVHMTISKNFRNSLESSEPRLLNSFRKASKADQWQQVSHFEYLLDFN